MPGAARSKSMGEAIGAVAPIDVKHTWLLVGAEDVVARGVGRCEGN